MLLCIFTIKQFLHSKIKLLKKVVVNIFKKRKMIITRYYSPLYTFLYLVCCFCLIYSIWISKLSDVWEKTDDRLALRINKNIPLKLFPSFVPKKKKKSISFCRIFSEVNLLLMLRRIEALPMCVVGFNLFLIMV